MKSLVLVLSLVSTTASASAIQCTSDGNTSLPVKIRAERSRGGITQIELTYSKARRPVTEAVPCRTAQDVTICQFPVTSAISRVIFHPAFGPSYTIRGQGEIAQWLTCR